MKNLEILQIEFRYNDKKQEKEDIDYISNKITIGVYNSFEEACIEGNKLMELMEEKFNSHLFPNGKGSAKKERFSKNGGCFGEKKRLITNLAYLKTPFDFYAKITELKYHNFEKTINEALKGVERYKEYMKFIDNE